MTTTITIIIIIIITAVTVYNGIRERQSSPVSEMFSVNTDIYFYSKNTAKTYPMYEQ
jgi:hypothetical protein